MLVAYCGKSVGQMTKKERQTVYEKYDGKCAYCGCELQKGWHVDHIEPRWHTLSEQAVKLMEQASNGRTKIKKGKNCIENYNPACPRCNKWKSTYSIEQFREEIAAQIKRLKRDSSQFRMALDYCLIEETAKPVVFYFETVGSSCS